MTPVINWDVVATGAASALIVTLAIEYFAKPRLEARKEEILDAHRSRRELLAATVRIAHAAAVVSTEVPGSADPPVRGNVYVEQDRQYERLQEEVRQLADDMGRYSGSYAALFLDLIVSYVSTLQGLLLSARSRTEQAEAIRDVTASMAAVLSPPRLWKVWKAPAYQRSLREARRLIASHTSAPS